MTSTSAPAPATLDTAVPSDIGIEIDAAIEQVWAPLAGDAGDQPPAQFDATIAPRWAPTPPRRPPGQSLDDPPERRIRGQGHPRENPLPEHGHRAGPGRRQRRRQRSPPTRRERHERPATQGDGGRGSPLSR